ncbi:MAG: MFS transporter [Patescibacteria group bacterium]|nr:MFS transporter [Patescibacteria group bacterium]
MNYKQQLNRNIRLSYLFYFLTGLAFTIPIWVSFTTRILSFSQIALFSAIGYGATTFLELPTGALADLIGRRKTVILGWIIISAATIYLGFADSVFDFFIVELIIAIGSALVSGADSALMFDSLKELGKEDSFPQYMAKAGLLHRVALAVGSFTGGYLYQYTIWLPYLMQGIMGLLATILVFLMIEPKIDSEKFSFKSYVKQTKLGFKQLFKSPYMIKLTIFYTLVGGITWSLIYYFNQPFATDVGFNEIEQSWIFGGIYLMISLTLLFLTKSKKLLNRNRVYLGFPIIMLLSLLPGLWVKSALAILVLFGNQLTGSARFALLDHYTNKEFVSKYRATAISALNMLVSIFYIIIVSISGPIQDSLSTRYIYVGLGVMTLIFVIPSALSLVFEYQNHQKRKAKALIRKN